MPVLVSDPVGFVSEWRFLVLRGQVVGAGWYFGDPPHALALAGGVLGTCWDGYFNPVDQTGKSMRGVCYRTHYTRGLSIAENARMILGASGDEVYVKTLMDPHAVDPPPIYYGAAKTIARQYADAGITATGWPFVQVLGEHAMVQRVMYRLENRTIWVFDDLMDLRREFRSWKYKTDKEGKPLATDAFENDNNHLLDGWRGGRSHMSRAAGARLAARARRGARMASRRSPPARTSSAP